MPLLLRVRTKDGTERLPAPDGCTLAQLRGLIQEKFGVPVEQQALAKSDAMGRQKGAALTHSQDPQPLGALGIANGELLFLDYAMERENQAVYVEKDPFNTQVKDGELRQQGKSQWTLTEFTDYRSSKEYVLGAPAEPHASACQSRCQLPACASAAVPVVDSTRPPPAALPAPWISPASAHPHSPPPPLVPTPRARSQSLSRSTRRRRRRL